MKKKTSQSLRDSGAGQDMATPDTPGLMPPAFQLQASGPLQMVKKKKYRVKKNVSPSTSPPASTSSSASRKRKAGNMSSLTPAHQSAAPIKKRKRGSKAEVRKRAQAILKSRIPGLLKNKMQPTYRSHTAQIFTGTDAETVDPIKKMKVNRALTRHLSTVFLQFDKSMEEVQAAINNSSQEIYISSNKTPKNAPPIHGMTLGNFLVGAKKAIGQKPELLSGDRETRHYNRITGNVGDDLAPTVYDPADFHNYTISYIPGLQGKHAETNIVDYRDSQNQPLQFDFIAGTRRPCVACFIHMILEGVDTSKFNPHHGSYWNSNNALHALTEKIFELYTISHQSDAEIDIEQAIDFALDVMGFDEAFNSVSEKFYQTKGYSGKKALNYDSDSEYEAEELGSDEKALPPGVHIDDIGSVGEDDYMDFDDGHNDQHWDNDTSGYKSD